MNILTMMIAAGFVNVAKKVWGQDLVDQAITQLVLYALDRWNELVPTPRDDKFIEHVKNKLEQ